LIALDRNKLEAELTSLLQRAEGPYRRALALIDSSVPHPQPSAEEISACLLKLEPLMRQTEEIERELAPRRQRWIESGLQAGLPLKEIFQQHQHLLGSLIGKINAMEQRMEQLRQRARPEVDAAVRHQQMQRAYGVRG